MIKWTKKDCLKAITELRSPLLNRQGQQTNDLTSSIEAMRNAKPVNVPFSRPAKPVGV
ncbi:unnamed protein product [marine sediment metagenome]|uniref:Uncharacterized protein n=1 Tax=marine sediment metagenome TaxID=412755 RepID=X0XN84_9ZZZZ